LISSGTGILSLTIPRTILDSTFEGNDDDFIVLVDGDEPLFSEIKNTYSHRTLSIQLQSGSEEIEIIGSKVIRNWNQF